MTDRDTTTRTRARAPRVGGVIHRMAVHDRVLRPDSERTTVATTRCTKGGCKLDGGRRMPGAGSPRKAPLGKPAFQPYWGKLAVRNDRGDRGNVGIIRSPIRASILPDHFFSRGIQLPQERIIGRPLKLREQRPFVFDGKSGDAARVDRLPLIHHKDIVEVEKVDRADSLQFSYVRTFCSH